MFGRGFNLFRLFGFQVRADPSWILLGVLVTWSLATGVFPTYVLGFPPETYWVMGAFSAVGLFVSIVFHELWHSLVARRFGLHIKGITLFIFGGVAEMAEEPPSAKAEFSMALAGPASSVVLAGFFLAVGLMGAGFGWPTPVTGVLGYLAVINLILAVFNLLPAFPLDGGRIFRSALWYLQGDLMRATRISSRIGSAFGFLMIGLGIYDILFGWFLSGLWWLLIGIFLRAASRQSLESVMSRMALAGTAVSRFMTADPVSVPGSATLRSLLDDYVFRHQFRVFPVNDEAGNLLGCVNARDLKEVPPAQWENRTVESIASSCSPENSISPHAEAIDALNAMNRTKDSKLIVVENNRAVGVISLVDLLRFVSMKLEFFTA
jgi:Zn-dependent protease